MPTDQRESIRKELDRIYESAMWSSQNQFEQAKIWGRRNLTLGAPSAALAAISGATGLITTTGRVPAAILALLSAALGAVVTTFNFGPKVESAQASANAYLAVQQDVRIFSDIDLPNMELEDAREQLSKIVARVQEVNKTAPVPSQIAYRRARKNIESGGQTYTADS